MNNYVGCKENVDSGGDVTVSPIFFLGHLHSSSYDLCALGSQFVIQGL